MPANMRITLTAWRQTGPDAKGAFETYDVPGINPDMSFLEMLDIVNERLQLEGKEPIAFDHDCREGICGSCGMMINGIPHGPERGTATCQLHMRKFRDGDHVTIEPWHAASFPLVKDLIVDRSAFDRIIEAGGFVTAPVGGAPDGNLIPIPKGVSDAAMDAAACIGCGACVAACPNGAAQLFTSAKLQHLNLMPQGQAERWDRTIEMVETMETLLRLVHEPPRVRGRVPEVDLDRLHRADEPRLRQGPAQATAPRGPDLPVIASENRLQTPGLQRTVSRAWARSATRSSAASMPTDTRTSAGSTSSGEPAADAWVMRPGCSMSDSTAPSDSASVNRQRRATHVERSVLSSGGEERHHPPEVAHLARRDRVAGMFGKTRIEHLRHGIVLARASARWRARSRSGVPSRSASVFTPRSTQIAVERSTAPPPSRSGESAPHRRARRRCAATKPPTTSE